MGVRPNFLIVGAPKCGTTAMARYLEAHPDVFVAARKDLHYFGSDLGFQRKDRLSEAGYLAHFEGAGAARAVGEASVWYLYSERAAQEIHAFDPKMRIIALLRQPVEVMYAHYAQLRLNGLGEEDAPTFEAALAAEPDRRAGRRLPENVPLPQAYHYRSIARFSEQLQRYYAVFPRDQVLVLLQEDLDADTAGAYRRTLEFLGVDPGFQPDLGRVNTSKVVRSEGLRRLIAATPAPLKGLIPRRFRRDLRKVLQRLNTRHAPRAPLDPALRAALTAELEPDIARLEILLGRDLRAWRDPGPG